jgi:hypothetical protein
MVIPAADNPEEDILKADNLKVDVFLKHNYFCVVSS